MVVCCSALQCVAVHCSVLQCIAVCCSALQCIAVHCSALQCIAVCCSVLQCIAVRCSVLHPLWRNDVGATPRRQPMCVRTCVRVYVCLRVSYCVFPLCLLMYFVWLFSGLFGLKIHIGWLRSVGSMKLQVSSAK